MLYEYCRQNHEGARAGYGKVRYIYGCKWELKKGEVTSHVIGIDRDFSDMYGSGIFLFALEVWRGDVREDESVKCFFHVDVRSVFE